MMELIRIIRSMRERGSKSDAGDPLGMLEEELRSALAIFWTAADGILENSGIRLLPADDGYASLEKNIFSALFLYSYHRAGISRKRRILYAAINQCLRGMVTGCDNLLDDEYKETLGTDLPEDGLRFRSVLDIMVSDRILFELLFDHFQERVLPPERVLEEIHHFKTGLLFQCPWSVPMIIEDCRNMDLEPLLQGLYNIGLGCQVMDDMVDLARDIRKGRHNFVSSLIYHQNGTDAWHRQTWQLAQHGGNRIERLDPAMP